MHIVSDVVQEGAVWPLQPAYNIFLQEWVGLYRAWVYILSKMVKEGAAWALQPTIYYELRSDGLQEKACHSV